MNMKIMMNIKQGSYIRMNPPHIRMHGPISMRSPNMVLHKPTRETIIGPKRKSISNMNFWEEEELF